VGVLPTRWMIHSPAGTSQVRVPSFASLAVRFWMVLVGTVSAGDSGSGWVGH
jgi:hypothetical protein